MKRPSNGHKTRNSMLAEKSKNVLRLTPAKISSTPFPTLLRQHLPKQFVDEGIFGTYNTVCQFIKHMKYDKRVGRLMCSRCKQTFYCSRRHQAAHWTKHKKTCKAPTSPPATETELRILHKVIALLNMCYTEVWGEDGLISVVVDFL